MVLKKGRDKEMYLICFLKRKFIIKMWGKVSWKEEGEKKEGYGRKKYVGNKCFDF